MKERKIPIENLKPDPVSANPSPEVSSEAVWRVHNEGLDEPLIVRPLEDGYGVLARNGEYLAAELAGLKEVPCVLRNDLQSDVDAIEVSFKESSGRSPWRTAKALTVLHKSASQAPTAGEVADFLKVTREEAEGYAQIARLPYWVKIRLKKPWNLKARDRILLRELGAGEETFEKNIPLSLCGRLAQNGDFVALAENAPKKAHRVIDKVLNTNMAVQEAIREIV